jgi:hypothetical protein
MLERLLGRAWKAICLQAWPYNTTVGDYLLVRAGREGQSVEKYIETHQVSIEPIRIDRIAPFWLAMGWAYHDFSEKAREYDAVVEFREQFGESTPRLLNLQLVREYIVSATGIRIPQKCGRCPEYPALPDRKPGMFKA